MKGNSPSPANNRRQQIMVPGVAPVLHKISNLVMDAGHKLDHAQMEISRRKSDPARTSNSRSGQPLRYAERQLESALVLLSDQLDILHDAFSAHFESIRQGADDFSKVHFLLDVLHNAEPGGDDYQ